MILLLLLERGTARPGRRRHAGSFVVDTLAPAVNSGGRLGARGCAQRVHKHPDP